MITVPASPPAEVLEALDTAAHVLGALRSRQVDLRVCVGESPRRGQTFTAELRRDDASLVRRLTARQLLALLSGKTTTA